ncbi:YcjF family protein [Anabaenopsis elenkinii]|uniref:DUF697 domain-containing protein n=1 Tax=Anabaenopsis elenkinii CCIBt3563 TaxID=2779889 RepID=A0A7S6RFL4_9CYAN|nr:DUF697 domain-containing protein [Anabaenopsis elenkinii]QOV23885.1 DUF697 domain-containing protein [Anabaenopsis elenkinii CCIBt3563]
MVVKLQRPILVGGLGLSFGLWMLQSWDDYILQLLTEVGVLGAVAVGGGLWLFQKNKPQQSVAQLHGMVKERATVETAIAQAEVVINQLEQEAVNHPALETLQGRLAQLRTELDREEITIAVTGGKSVGKSSLVTLIESKGWGETDNKVTVWETTPLFTQTGEQPDIPVVAAVKQSDFVLFLTNGDLTDSEFQSLQQLKAANQPLWLIFNKQDQYLPQERASILLSLKQRISENVVGTVLSPLARKVRKHESDGTIQEWTEQPEVDIQELTQQLLRMVEQQRQELIWTTTWRKAKLLQAASKNWLNETRGDRSIPIIEQYQWISAAAAFANPVPALDILATAVINAQMVIDLGRIYQQRFSLEQAQTLGRTMGGLMLKLGLVELSTKAVSTVLKSNAMTFVAGGVVQGVSAAYLTRVAGLSLVAYFAQQEVALDSGNTWNLEKLQQTVEKVFESNQQITLLSRFVQQGVKRLSPQPEPVN